MELESVWGEIGTEELMLDAREVAARLHVPVEHTDELLKNCNQKVREAIDCRFCARRVGVSVSDGKVDLGFGEFFSKDLSAVLSGCDEAYIFAVTLGHGIDRLIARLSAVSASEGFIADALASAYAEAAADLAETRIMGNRVCRPRFSVGYGDLSLELQPRIVEYLNAGKLLGITLGKSLLMSPKKSITAIVGIKK